MKHLRKFNENKDFNVEEIKEYLKEYLLKRISKKSFLTTSLEI